MRSASGRRRDALKVLYREQEDVEELERLSFASFLARIQGEQADSWTKSGGEAVAPKARYDAARRDPGGSGGPLSGGPEGGRRVWRA